MSATRGVVITTIGNALPPAVLLLTQILLARGLGVDGRGEVAAATAPFLLAVAVFTLGLPESLTYFVSKGGSGLYGKLAMSLAALAVAGAMGTLLVAVFAQALSAGSNQLADLMMLVSAAVVPALFTAALRGVAYGAHAWWLVAAERTLGAATQLVGVFALSLHGSLSVLNASLVTAASTFAGSFVYLFSRRWRLALRGSNNTERSTSSDLTSLASYAWRMWAGAIAGTILVRLDQVLMTPLAGVEELGIYVVAVSVGAVALLFNGAVGQVIFAVESGAASETRVGRAARITTLVTALLAAVVGVTSPWFIPLFFGDEFMPAVPVLAILLLAYAISTPGSVAGGVLSARGYPGLRSLSMTFSAILSVIFMLLLIPAYGAVGAALATFVGASLSCCLNIFLLHRYCDVPLSDFYRFRSSDLDVVTRLYRKLR
jgi:O-antigen/teichoic acid export membrane protein